MKQVIIVRKDLNMRKGKMVAQGAHASLAALLMNAESSSSHLQVALTPEIKEWMEGRHTKITVGIDSEEQLKAIYEQAKAKGLLCSLITDMGLTEFAGVPTITAAAIGPAPVEVIDAITGKLSLL